MRRGSAMAWVFPLGVLAVAVALAGGYAFHWPWTGISRNDQLWDLLHVIVLPVSLATLPLWYRTRTRWHVEWRVVLTLLCLTFGVLVVGGYALNWQWTGFQGNTLWDWLELLALPVVIAALPLWFATHKRMEGRWRIAGIAGAIVFIVVVLGGYMFSWGWTGFPGNTLWDWLRLLLVPFLLPATLAWASARAASREPT